MKPLLLVVEDELLLRMDLVDLAEDAGFETLQAGSADEAMDILTQRDDIKVLFTDIRMPGEMDGLALAHTVRERWPSKVIVICSGNEKPTTDELPENVTFMPKPIGPKIDGLLSAIKAELAA